MHALVAGTKVDPVCGKVPVQDRREAQHPGAPDVIAEREVVALDLAEQPDRPGHYRAGGRVEFRQGHDL